MNMMHRLLVVVLVVAATAAAAQTPAQEKVRAACMGDIRQYCSAELLTFDREKVRACLRTNIKKTTPACQAAAKARQAEIRAAKKAQ
jgi:hypothetical protein